MNDEKANLFWKAKLAAWLHDPPAKGLLLGRDPGGHESSVREVLQLVFGAPAFPDDVEKAIRQGDHWASAADRPQAPQIPHHEFALSTFLHNPVFKHPLEGSDYELLPLADLEAKDLKVDGVTHLKSIILSTLEPDQRLDARKAFLALWRFGPENPESPLGKLWALLPADTRIPDHSIWEHLRISSAFAGCFAINDDPALLSVSLGPVQSFITQARSTSDLWAGSHLLSQMSWEAIRVVATEFGPDSILLPDLWSVPIVDVWLMAEGLHFPDEKNRDWFIRESDANPLFTAALPNTFTALVPASRARETARKIETTLRQWVLERATRALSRILRAAGRPETERAYAHTQLERQLEGFPEVHWSLVPFSTVKTTPGDFPKAVEDQERLAELLSTFGNRGGFWGSPLQKLLGREISLDGQPFYKPNPGVYYPALFELLSASRDAAKSVRAFTQTREEGFRCTLCGEREWLSLSQDHLGVPRGDRGSGEGKTETLWTLAATGAKSWTRKGDHLCGLCTLKRVWPALFRDEMAAILPHLEEVRRYVVSTHTMALAPSLDRLLNEWILLQTATGQEERNRVKAGDELLAEISRLDLPAAALPRNLVEQLHRKANGNARLEELVRKAPSLLDLLSEEEPGTAKRAEDFEKLLESAVGQKLENYYALLLLDGDRMGRLVSGDPEVMPRYGELWHPKFYERLAPRLAPSSDLRSYVDSPRALSPSLHAAISRSLNSFALHAAPFVVERLYKGKVIYAGGDDLLAMCSVDEVLEILLMVRAVYSGGSPAKDSETLRRWSQIATDEHKRFKVANAHVLLEKGLHRMMGLKATASSGVVIAHHKAPLGSVLRELRAAEKRAKGQGGRNAFSIHVLKRSGGAARFTARFWGPAAQPGDGISGTPPGLLMRLSGHFKTYLSRRAAYHILGWLDGVPDLHPGHGAERPLLEPGPLVEMLSQNLRHQMLRQLKGEVRRDQDRKATAIESITNLCRQLAEASANPDLAGKETEPREWIREAVTVAEFLSRESRR